MNALELAGLLFLLDNAFLVYETLSKNIVFVNQNVKK